MTNELIKYRGYRQSSGRWVYGINANGDAMLPQNTFRLSKFWELVEENVLINVGQFVGLQDKSWKDIYDGDIVEVYGIGLWCGSQEKYNELTNKVMHILPIRYDVEELSFMVGDTRLGVYWAWHNLKVIGNIYQNSELMDEDK